VLIAEPTRPAPASQLAPWLRTLSDATGLRRGELPASWVPSSGDEAAWLAATVPGVPVGIHADRLRAAEAVLASFAVDVLILDDGFQTPVQREVDLLLLCARRDPPLAADASLWPALREAGGAVARAHCVAFLGEQPAAPLGWLCLRRRPAALRALQDGRPVVPETLGALQAAAAVGDPNSVIALALESGLRISGFTRIRDHGRPRRAQERRLMASGVGSVLVTEKDAVGWAGRSRAPERFVVLSQRIEGAEAVAQRVLALLGEASSPRGLP
jgi:tetraacyldisaccharide-1-P 4'-kinase